MEKLTRYRRKRDFSQTPEPSPGKSRRITDTLKFVVQKHAAKRLHYDFRMELDGVLKSWALPKGPSTNPGDKRLAVLVEDHPLEYAGFEGTIPEGQYGAGEVIVWDEGQYLPAKHGQPLKNRREAEEAIREGLEEGKLAFVLKGKKLKGEWTMIHMKAKNWLLIKHQDEFADGKQDILRNGKSVRSGQTLKHSPSSPTTSKAEDSFPAPSQIPGAKEQQLHHNVRPMLASLTDVPFTDNAWLFEPKLDGIRAIAFKDGSRIRLVSRNGRETGAQFPLVVDAIRQQAADKMILDGEIVTPDPKGRPSFQLLQKRIGLTRRQDIEQAEESVPVQYYVFDLLYLEGYDLTQVELRYRKEALERAVVPSSKIRILEYLPNEGETLYKAALEQGLEGIIAKRVDSRYQAGLRSSRWLKVKKFRSDDFIVGGYTLGRGSRANTFGSLLLGYYGADQRLEFVGAVGTGFDERNLADLREVLEKIRTSECPFNEEPALDQPAVWVRPIHVAEVKFAEWTRDKRLRAPVFLRLRPDKSASEVYLQPPRDQGQTQREYDFSDHLQALDRQLEESDDAFDLAVSEHTISLNHLNKILWPAASGHKGLTKREYLRYLARLSPFIIPHLRGRPITMSRYPDGIQGEQFFQKDWTNPLPGYVDSVSLPSEHSGKEVHYLVCNNLATLLWLGQLANLEWHAWFSRTDPHPDTKSLSGGASDVLDYPDFVVFDIDPYIYSGDEAAGDEPQLNREAFGRTRQVAFWLKEKLDSLSLTSFVKTSGVTGLHVYVPILRQFDYGAARAVAETICTFLLREYSETVTLEWAVNKRRGKIFLDYNQNVRGKTLAVPYSPRATPAATVSTPVEWNELSKIYPTDLTIDSIPSYLSGRRDPWLRILEQKNDLATLLDAGAPGMSAQFR